MNNNELYHHGILGMKWGVRRYQNADGSLTAAGRRRQKHQMSDDAKEARAIKKKKVNQMTNAELRKLNERQNLERQHKQLNPNRIAKTVASVAAGLGTMAAIQKNGSKIIKTGKTVVKSVKRKWDAL